MKYLYIILIILVQLVDHKAYAGSVAGFGGYTEITGLIELAESVPTTIAAIGTSASVTTDMVSNTILKPIATGLINVAQQQIANSIIDWVNGGFEGQPLIISNPEKFIRDQGRVQVRLALDGIPTDSVFGDSIFNNIVSQYKDSNDITKQLKALSSSDIPGIIQQNLCNDQTLTSLATNDVTDGEGNYVQEEVAARKTELFNYACSGDANRDPETAAKIVELSTQVQASTGQSLGGWDQWLATTGGDNAYTKGVQAVPIIKQADVSKQEEKKNEIFQGAGPVSQTKCVEYGEAQPGKDPKCLREEVLTPGEVIASSLEKAANAGLDRLTNLTGEGLTSLITNLALTKLTSGLNKAISASPSNTSEVVLTQRPPSKDLIADPTRKREIQNPMKKQFTFFISTLNELEQLDQTYLAEVNSFQSRITSGQVCYDGLVSDSLLSRSSQQYTDASAFYSTRQNRVNNIKAVISPELSKIAEARTFTDETQAKMAASNSTEEISALFDAYMEKVDSEGYPQSQDLSARKVDYNKNKKDSENDLSSAQHTGMNMLDYQNMCDQIRASAGGNNGGWDNGGGNPGGA
jgi:hypothetical protein